MGARPSDDAGGGGAETDDWADAVTIAYDSNGRLATVKTLKRGTSPAPDTVLNAVGFHYSALGLPEHFDQNPLGDLTYSGTTPTGTTKRVGSTYDLKKMPDGNWVRANGVVYPSGQSLDIGYGTGGTSDRISRPQSLGFHAATAAVEYQFLGAATPVIASYPAPGIRLDRSMAQSGAQSDGQYPCMDAFGRVTRQLWIDSGYAPGSISGFANRPALVDTTYAYTRLSGLTSKLDARPGATMLAQHAYTLDGLLRLLADQRGTASFPSSQAKPGSQDFSYDFIGNLPSMRTDTSSAGTFSSGTTDASTSTFNMVNEIAAGSFVPLGGTPQSIGFAWDHGGNLSSRGIAGAAGYGWTYKHDRWGRLTQVDFTAGSTPQPALRAQYTGLGMRCVVDRAPDSWVPPAAPTVSQRRLGYFDLGWQLLEEQIDDDLPLATSGAESDIDQVEQLVWGMRHVDDLVLRRVNSNYAGGADTDFSDAGDRAGDQFLGDLQFSVVAAVDSAGALLERVEYDAYGQAQHHWPEGITGAPGGGVVAADSTAASGAVGKSIGQTGYLADADLDRSGTVTAAEASAVAAKVGTAGIPAGRISAYGNTVGWCGYRFNAGPDLLTVRFRHYDPAPGVARWLERDPAGYMDGASLYGYLAQRPTVGTDPSGRFGNIVGGAILGAIVGGISAAINGEDLEGILIGAGKGAVVGAIAGATFGATLVVAGVTTTSTVIAAGAASGMAGAAAHAMVYEGRDPTAEELVVGGVTGGALGAGSRLLGPILGRLGRNRSAAPSGAACFLAGTLVITASSATAVPIESLLAGDLVASVDPATGAASNAVVDAAPVRLFEGTVYDITVDPGEPGGGDETTISATGEHPFLLVKAGEKAPALEDRAVPEAIPLLEPVDSRDGRWVAVKDIAEGDILRTMSRDGVAGTAAVAKVSTRYAMVPVYNLTVRGTSRYLVSSAGVVVHNKGELPRPLMYPPEDGFQFGIRSLRTLERGILVDRFGGPGGTYLAPAGTPFPARSLRPGPLGEYHLYEVISPLEVWEGTTAPWFGQPGNAVQWKTLRPIEELLGTCLKEVTH
ncbi:MAG: glycohydrolase toxin TNT-related protein [Phycisphaerales bacterium]